jgi:hypothetical protein
MTVPGGVPNLPAGALTLDTLASLQDMTPETMRARSAARIPSTFNATTLGDPTSDFSFGGLIAQLFAAFTSAVANADPADIEGPDDLPALLTGFIEELPIIGTLAGLPDAVYGTYDGDDPVLLFIELLFAPIRALMGGGSLPTDFPEEES